MKSSQERSWRIRTVLFSLSIFGGSSAFAQGVVPPSNPGTSTTAAFADVEAEPAPTPPEPRIVSPEPSCPTPLPCPPCPPSEAKSPEVVDSDAVFRAFEVYADEERSRRYAGGAASLLFGGATMGLGAGLADYAGWSPEPWLVAGGVSVGLGVLTLVMPSAAEKTAAQYQVARIGHSSDEARAFEASWAKGAEDARGKRIIGSIFSLVVGAAGAGVGGAIFAGAITMTDQDRLVWGSVATSAGVAFLATGVAGLFIPTPLESSFAAFKVGKPVTPAAFSISVAPSAGTLALGGRF